MDKVTEEVTNIKYTIRKFLELIREIFDADVCYLYLINEDMDVDEKLNYLGDRIKEMKEAYAEKVELLKDPNLFRGEQDLVFPTELNKVMDQDVKILKFIDISQKDGKTFWTYDYRKRPRKYVIFKNYGADKKIYAEGLTAYIYRSKETKICNSRKDINLHRSSANLNYKYHVKPMSDMTIGFPLIEEIINKNGDKIKSVIGVLTVENYTAKEYTYTLDSEEVKEASVYLPLLVRLINSSKIQFSENSYQKLFGGIGLLDLLKRINPTKEKSSKDNPKINEKIYPETVELINLANKINYSKEKPSKEKPPKELSELKPTINEKIYTDTLHLFYVLKRKEYIGYEEILDRVTEYANDISKHLGLTTESEPFTKFLDKFKKHEELLLYGLNDYRDHFMHQFHVFVSGYIIINLIGIEYFQSKIQESMKLALKEAGQNLVISECNVLRIWFLVSFYHDHAYIFEKIDSELEKFFTEVLGHDFSVKFNWEQLLRKESNFPKYLTDLQKFFVNTQGTTNPDTLIRNYLDSIINTHDHGVLSALLLINYYLDDEEERIYECLYAALAISFHNKPIYENLMEGSMRRISFESFPIAFLLSYCDTAQSFGRLGKKEEYPVRFSDIKFKDNRITYELIYMIGKGKKIPTDDTIEKWAKQAHNVFKSNEYFFEITHYKAKEETDYKEQIYTLSYGVYRDTPSS
jgi:hypothetical protein